jgi:Kef-type K+ transport system membrane component KefB
MREEPKGDEMGYNLSGHRYSLLTASSLALAILWLLGPSSAPAQLLLQIALLLTFAAMLGGLAKKLHQPAVLGEILGGIILGPTVFGTLAPGIHSELFPAAGESAEMLHAIAYLGLIAFVFIAGLEVDLTSMKQQRKSTLLTSIFGILLPFFLGFSMVMLLPAFWGVPQGGIRIFALFMGTALSISALPVIARILMDLDLMKEKLGMIIIGAATCNDVVGWSLFALILSSIDNGIGLAVNLGMTVGLFGLTAFIIYLTISLKNSSKSRQMPLFWGWIVDLMAISMLVASIASEFMGAHGIFGAFLAGVILSQRQARRDLILKRAYVPVVGILAPIYFASIGLKADFAGDFVLSIVLLVFLAACAGKIIGASLGAWLGGIGGRDALAVGFGLNARGAMEIVLASAALDYGLIDKQIFVALVIMALATTMISGTMIQRLITKKSAKRAEGLSWQASSTSRGF